MKKVTLMMGLSMHAHIQRGHRGSGKINMISQAVFEGMKPKSDEECLNISSTGPWPGGCKCNVDEDCIISE